MRTKKLNTGQTPFNSAGLLLGTLLALGLTLSSCGKGGSAPMKPGGGNTVTSPADTAYLIGTWILNRVEVPQGAAWIDQDGTVGYSTMTLGTGHALSFANSAGTTASGTWGVSADGRLLSEQYGSDSELDTIATLDSDTLRLVSPRQAEAYGRFYPYYRSTYFRKQ
jgi:hypothetical protein